MWWDTERQNNTRNRITWTSSAGERSSKSNCGNTVELEQQPRYRHDKAGRWLSNHRGLILKEIQANIGIQTGKRSTKVGFKSFKILFKSSVFSLLAWAVYRLGNVTGEFCERWLIISHFSPLCVWISARERGRVLVCCHIAFLAANSPTSASLCLHLIFSPLFLSVFEEQVNSEMAQTEILRDLFLSSFPGWLCSCNIYVAHRLFLCAACPH